ncbi:vacuolar protein sorting-associated protein 2-like protein 2-like [Hibiscus syriacus]|uniref:Patatin n=1 Tax=Hibiscus syriacus TaxID=106335 RepID=A0A6A2WGI0_HIBSY|nr:patatin-like protein 6 [Hibiscus syriacus]KAE8656891.1 vacuolar protein sorting-associated protein 2-like protein 2-like [Hibiscus syriacus]
MELPVNEVDSLTNKIFSILENKFLFGDHENATASKTHHEDPIKSGNHFSGKVRILSIDSGSFSDGILAAQSLLTLQTILRQKWGNPNAAIAQCFDVVAGSGAGAILAAMLFTQAENGAPLFTADQALQFLVKNRRKLFPSSPQGLFWRIFRPSGAKKLLGRTFRELTLKDTLKPVLIPCYDLCSNAPFLFSRADALEIDGYDFKMKDVCYATSADPTVVGAVEMRSVDERTKILAVEGGVAMNNPTAAAITHVLNNKQEFPFCNGVEDLLVLSLGNAESGFDSGDVTLTPTRTKFIRIAGEGASDIVDQAVSMAFGESGNANNYVRIQGNRLNSTASNIHPKCKIDAIMSLTKEMLAQRNVESHLFKGKKKSEVTNLEKLEMIGSELIKEQERRKTSILPTAVLKQKRSAATPRTSSASATTISSQSSC